MIDLSTALDSRRQMEKGRLTVVAAEELTGALTGRVRRALMGRLSEGPAQRVRLEMLVHQVQRLWRQKAA